jgi:hypothetical protein
MITISPRWTPASEDDLSPDGLRRRIDLVRSAWHRVWSDVLSAGGLAAATLSIELSDKGHVHGHALVYGPFVLPDHLRRAAQCIVDVRKVRHCDPSELVVDYASPRPRGSMSGTDFAAGQTIREAVVEAAKYCIKLPVESHRWLAGEARRVVHPALAARWAVACRSQQLVSHYGVMRDAIAAAEMCAPEEQEEPAKAPVEPCRHCGAPISLDPAAARQVRLSSWLMRGAAAWRATRSYRFVRRL